MTHFLDKTFSVAMPQKGHWPWPDQEPPEKQEEEPPEDNRNEKDSE